MPHSFYYSIKSNIVDIIWFLPLKVMYVPWLESVTWSVSVQTHSFLPAGAVLIRQSTHYATRTTSSPSVRYLHTVWAEPLQLETISLPSPDYPLVASPNSKQFVTKVIQLQLVTVGCVQWHVGFVLFLQISKKCVFTL